MSEEHPNAQLKGGACLGFAAWVVRAASTVHGTSVSSSCQDSVARQWQSKANCSLSDQLCSGVRDGRSTLAQKSPTATLLWLLTLTVVFLSTCKKGVRSSGEWSLHPSSKRIALPGTCAGVTWEHRHRLQTSDICKSILVSSCSMPVCPAVRAAAAGVLAIHDHRTPQAEATTSAEWLPS